MQLLKKALKYLKCATLTYLETLFHHIYLFLKDGTLIRSMEASPRAFYGKRVRIGKNVYVDDKTSIGDYSYINRNSSVEHCSIGRYCSVSSGVFICPAEHNIRSLFTSPHFLGGGGDERESSSETMFSSP